ncbi:ATP-binding protein [Candidatus Accumulibacter sp. ACC003]|uniref:sensor histidine kinase n=1 Tax=Candidatus Accumulibacter sp. ACC003 TaxID=2823334 RepID=UPI0025C26EC5|nr:ATP-binding protein [Candidatus Accumulibacter sp. ACC003]
MLIRSQLRLAALLPGVFALLVGALLWASWKDVDQSRYGAQLAEQASREIASLIILNQEHMLYTSPRVAMQARKQHAAVSELLADAHFSEPASAGLLDAIRTDLADNGRLMNLLLDGHDIAREEVMAALLLNVQVLRFKVQQLADLQRQSMERIQHTADTRIITVLVASSLFSVLALGFLSRRLSQGFSLLLTGLERAASGDLEHALPITSGNEFGRLSRTFNDMSAQLNRARAAQARAAEALKTLNLELEKKVVKRTAKLASAYQELKQSQAKAVQMEKLSALGTLVGGVAHEVNNPLMGIHGYLAYAIDKLEPGRPREMLERAVGEVERVARIVKNMLVYARMQPAAANQHCDPARVIADTLALIEGEMRQADVAFDLRLPALVPRLRCTGDALQQVLLNLLLNACHACQESPAPHRVTLTLLEQPETARAVLSIADNGPGIPKALRTRIFDPFFTTRSTGSGTGLGLAVSRQLIDNAGGQLTQADAPGGGAVFAIEIGVFREEK